MTCFVVYDTNVLLSALPTNHDDAAAVGIIDRITTGEIIPLLSPEILEKYRQVLHDKRYNLPEQSVRNLLNVICKYALPVNPAASEDLALLNLGLPFYQVVMRRRENGTYPIQDSLKKIPRRPDVVTAREMLDLLDRR